MSLATEVIADLDAELAETGQTVTLRRVVPNAPAVEKPFRAFVRGYRPDEIVGGIQQGDSLVIMSPTGLPAEFSDLKRGDRVIINGRTRNIGYVDPVYIGGTLTRINALVTG